ncbi:aminopeptidase P family protein [Klugiella xanthotipulae]|uniref:Xaa-Pro aminopeptidase n=1 Tax=Klugiella xanthotipulae TaxID=244735 RepID=A0A543HRW9_9MICO|nr:aminopeptidase P family protein [Klugiella xanthotipulae]TQM61014.1 Xaa-Pro aminopeptidase [Klugiella xanthotipulae]TQM63020.1 Xaa-Pro aminopeptidase [Klugiella xanthotipulae]
MSTSNTPAESAALVAEANEAVVIDNSNRSTTPTSEAFTSFIMSNWADREDSLPPLREQAPFAARRRAELSRRYPGQRLVIRSGEMKQRSNDTFYEYRAHSAFSHLTGWATDSEPGSVLVFEPTPTGHDVTLYFRERAGRDSDEFYANPEIGEFWIGPRPSLTQVSADLGLPTLALAEFAPTEADVTLADTQLLQDLSELRLVKDPYEIQQMRDAVAATARGFDDIVAQLPSITDHSRGERLVEGAFHNRARLDGNAVGYETIAASGSHACILHWTRNDGPVTPGDLILIDAGVELDSLYTADITRTLPINGTFSPTQRQVYEAVREAADAALAVVRPGIKFREIHATAMNVIARYTSEWGFLPVSLEDTLGSDVQYHRRYMVHGTSHHLGIDVHDCAQARRDLYLEGTLEAGMVFTIEPGLYFQPDDLTVPAEFRGIGVRIEDDILVTETGAENLSAYIPRTADEVEAWIARHNAS